MSYTAPSLLVLLAASVSASSVLDTLSDTTSLVASDVVTITDSVEKVATSVLSSQSIKESQSGFVVILPRVLVTGTTLKQLLQADYNQSSPPDLSKLTLNLYTRDTHVVFNLSDAAETIPTSPWFKNGTQLILYMHGFLNSPSEESFQDVNDAFLSIGNYNVLALDSSSLLGLSTLYIGATTNVRYIGEKLGAVLANMTKVGFDASSMHLIGHSLGAHISGFAGKTFNRLIGSRVGRITGLDPAGPCYTDIDSELKLNSMDADFVDVIHTDKGVFGLDEVIGHADFYPNDGTLQPDCYTQICDHNFAWKLFAESVLNQTMPAVRCDTWDDFKNGQCNTTDISQMGYSCNSTASGLYYLQTNGSEPYGRGVDGLTYVNRDGVVRNLISDIGLE